MPRFSLSPAPSDDDEGDYVLRKPQDFSRAAHVDQADDEEAEEEEEEPPHPIGFGSPWGKTSWFGLDPPPPRITGNFESSSSSPGQCRYGLDDLDFVYSSDEEEDQQGFHVDKYVQSYPPITSYIRSSTAPTPMLMRYHRQSLKQKQQRDDEDGIDDDIDKLSALLYASCFVDNTKPPPQILLPPWSQTSRKIQETMNMERQRVQQQHLEAAQGLKLLLLDAERQANTILLQRQKEDQEAEDLLQQERIAQEARDLAEQEAYDAAMAKKEQLQKQKQVAQDEQSAKLLEAKAKEAQKTEYIQKAKKLVADLIPIRQSVEPFETSKNVSKRRLQMKKIVRGKVNTLNEDANKVREVAQEVSQAVSQARSEDEQVKQMLQQNQPNVSKEMARGKRYLVDLLASNAMERVQAESFNGTKGDGFPLAAMLAMISTEQKELVPILAAHIYTVCPIAIPALPTNLGKDSTEEALMSSLGMQKDKKTGEYESFPRFLARTENVLSLVANVMSSTPSTHALLGGHRGAVDWLTRFLSLLPSSSSSSSPLPLVTAPVLIAFLTGAGHMLAKTYPDKFQKQVEYIQKSVIPRLDDGEIGRPSSVRLKKVLEGGFDGFQTNLPARALGELYHGASPSSGAHGTGGSSNPSPFGSLTGQSSYAGQPSFAGGSENTSNNVANPFGGGMDTSKDPFGRGQPSTNNPFMGGLGAAESTNRNNSTRDPFGALGNNASNAAFGAGSNPVSANNPSPFGGGLAGSNNNVNSNDSPFGGGGGMSNPSPFGAVAGTTFSSAFGGARSGNTAGGNANQSPFGVGGATASPFGGGASTMSSPFGGGAGTVISSPFVAVGNTPNTGMSTTNINNPFGGVGQPSGNAPLPFSNGGANMSTNSSPFGGGANAGMGNPSSFGVSMGAFGSSSNNAVGSGAAFGSSNNQASTPFGGGGGIRSNPSPFGGAAGFGGGNVQNASLGQTPFAGGGGGNNGNSPFGAGAGGEGRGDKQICKFFAQGRCRFGDNCKFSHDTQPQIAAGGYGGIDDSDFGGGFGRRKQR